MGIAFGRRLAGASALLLSVLFANTALAAAGTVVFVSGEATLDRGAVTLPIEKDLAVESGDLLATGYDGRVQVRMADGQWISLFPNTRFRIDDFQLTGTEGTGGPTVRSAARSLYSLLRGGFRTITNSAGRLAPAHYRVRTPVATLGIRGTIYATVLDNGLYIGTDQGAVSAANEAGTSVVKQGQYAYIKDSTTPAQFLDSMPKQLAEAGLEPEAGGATESTAAAAEAGEGDFLTEPLVPILGAIGLAIILSSGDDGDDDTGGPSGTTGTTP